MNTEQSSLENILTKKYEYLESILARTQNFLNQYKEDAVDVDDVKNFLDARGSLIKSIQQLDNIEVESVELLDKNDRISSLARKIVEIDKYVINLIEV